MVFFKFNHHLRYFRRRSLLKPINGAQMVKKARTVNVLGQEDRQAQSLEMKLEGLSIHCLDNIQGYLSDIMWYGIARVVQLTCQGMVAKLKRPFRLSGYPSNHDPRRCGFRSYSSFKMPRWCASAQPWREKLERLTQPSLCPSSSFSEGTG